MMEHKPDCAWEPEREHCTCGALYMAAAYRFSNGNVIAFDQFGHQMPYYQRGSGDEASARIKRDWPAIDIKSGEMIR